MVANNIPKFEYDMVSIQDLQANTKVGKDGQVVVDSITVKDQEAAPSQRFWTSLYARFGFNQSFFKYFSHEEVFTRLSKVNSSDRVRICTQIAPDKDGNEKRTLLGVSNVTKPVIHSDGLMELLHAAGAEEVKFADGIIESFHTPRIGTGTTQIGGDDFQNRFVLQTPIDGYGNPCVYLAMLRLVCANGMVGLSRAFRSDVSVGKSRDNVLYTLGRTLENFNSDEGYAALRSRTEAATSSWASLREAQSLYKMIIKMHNDQRIGQVGEHSPSISKWAHQYDKSAQGAISSPVLKAFYAMTGDPHALYGLSNLDALNVKRQRALPVKASVYDMVNFATELATHYADAANSRRLHGWVGSLVSDEYDLEGTMQQLPNFADFHIKSKLGSGMTGSDYATSV